MEELRFPTFDYYLDESDPDVVILRRQEDGSFVAGCSARGATKEGIVAAANEDYGRLMEAYTVLQQGQSTEGQRSTNQGA